MTDQATAPKARTRKAGSKTPADKKGPATGQKQSAAPTPEGAAILAEVRDNMGKQTQAAGATVDPSKPKRQRKPAGDKGAAQQGGGDQGSAGSTGAGGKDSAGQTAGNEMRGGTKQVLMEEVKLPGRGGRPQGEEEYPFGELPSARKEAGEIVGLSFFIPDADGPDSHLATARKRHKPTKFWSRATMEKIDGTMVKGLRVWKAPEGA